MSFTNCPSCGKQISDKATKCPACEFDLNSNSCAKIPNKIICEECNCEVPTDTDTCPNCGCPVSNATIHTKKGDFISALCEKIKGSPAFEKCNGLLKNKKRCGIISAVIVCLLIVGIITGTTVKSNRAKANYQATLNTAVSKMLEGGTDAESAGNLIKSVWYNTIYKKSDTSTNKYTKKNGSFNKDFNDSLSALYSDASFKISINLIKSNQIAVESLMKSLKNPPNEYKDAYYAIKDLYDSYNELTGLVINPTGSLTTFSSNFNSADTNMSTCYKAVKVYTN